MNEPDYIAQAQFPTVEERHAWIQSRCTDARAEGCTHLRAAYWPADPTLILLEGWKVRPDDEGEPRFRPIAAEEQEMFIPGDLKSALSEVMRQGENDLKSAHAEICKLQGLDPAKHKWPEWSSPANTLRWFAAIREKFGIVPSADDPGRPVPHHGSGP